MKKLLLMLTLLTALLIPAAALADQPDFIERNAWFREAFDLPEEDD